MWYVLVFFAGTIVSVGLMLLIFYQNVSELKTKQRKGKVERTRLEEFRKKLRDIENQLQQEKEEITKQKVGYNQLLSEIETLKQDMSNVSIENNKKNIDFAIQDEKQKDLESRANSLGEKYLKDNIKWIGNKLNSNNYATSKMQITKTIELCRSIGFSVTKAKENELLCDLKEEYEKYLRREFEREEQARIKAQIREEERFEREVEKELQRIEREKVVIQEALDRALKNTNDKHSVEIEGLKTKLREAEERAERTKSQAELTKSGHVYVISNIGSFGKDVFKIGMTRRLEPLIRVRELSSASVPFPYDVHMMISCNNAPALENSIHKSLHKQRINKVNQRKEFFNTDIQTLVELVEKHHGNVDYIADPEALQYRDSINMTSDDFDFIEETIRKIEDSSTN